MACEIERKFLLASEAWRDGISHRVELRDGLLSSDGGRKLRVRFYDDRATLTFKGPRRGISRDEFEYDIPPEDAEALLERHCPETIIEKTRYFIYFGGFEWSVDEFHGPLAGMVLAEIELKREDASFPLPPWIGREVTGDPAYRQGSLLAARRTSPASGLSRCIAP